jgi:hypothetical protein
VADTKSDTKQTETVTIKRSARPETVPDLRERIQREHPGRELPTQRRGS